MTAPSDDVDPLGRWEGAAFMATGVALVVHILIDVPLWLSALTAVAAGACVIAISARRHPVDGGSGRRVLRVAVISACAALVAYDLSRLALTTFFDFHVTPFKAFPHFGRGLLGDGSSDGARWVAGSAFHVVNALTFGIAYTLVVGRQPSPQRGFVMGVLFGLGLEAAMIGLYPAWLQVSNMREFLSMSVVGHIFYGGTLGVLAQRGIARLEHAQPEPEAVR
jgi:hypothetical protein